MNLSPDQLALVLVLLPIVVSLSGALFKFLEGLLPKNVQFQVQSALDQVFAAVEQAMPGATGAAKKAAAIALAKETLKSFHLKGVSDATVDGLIEAAVAGLHQDAAAATSAVPTAA